HDPALYTQHGAVKTRVWEFPVSVGLQLRFRLCKYVDFFAEGRYGLFGDEFDGSAIGQNVDMNLNVLGGFNINFGGREFKSFNPCDYLGYINQLNGQVNDLRGALATCGAALAAAEAQLPCPEVVAPECPDAQAPLLSTVRFTINSAKITSTETVNVYNIAQWMKANPNSNVVIKGYADKDTGTASYNMKLSERRAQNVYNMLTKEYGIPADRLTIKAEGSDSQVYDVNNWNRIVIFSQN
ncbi:OmpA family protein, partial [Muribaculum intestinale]